MYFFMQIVFLADGISYGHLLRWLKPFINILEKTLKMFNLPKFQIKFPPFVRLLIIMISLRFIFQRRGLDIVMGAE